MPGATKWRGVHMATSLLHTTYEVTSTVGEFDATSPLAAPFPAAATHGEPVGQIAKEQRPPRGGQMIDSLRAS